MKPPTLTRRDVDRNLSTEFVRRGIAYARDGRVSGLRKLPERNRYVAFVSGTQPRPYRVEVDVLPGSGGPRLYGRCSCPVGVNCKHVAAVLLSALDQDLLPDDDRTVAHDDDTGAPAHAATGGKVADTPLSADWLHWIQEAANALSEPATRSEASSPTRILYLIDLAPRPQRPGVRVRLVTARARKDGGYGSVHPWRNVRSAVLAPPSFVQGEDVRILKRLLAEGPALFEAEFTLRAEGGAEILPILLHTGRCHFASADGIVLRAAESRLARPEWVADPGGGQVLRWHGEGPVSCVLPLSPPWYVDQTSGDCGPLETGLAPRVGYLLALVPPIQPGEAAVARMALEKRLPPGAVPMPPVARETDVTDVRPVPCLRLETVEVEHRGVRGPLGTENIARLRFDYAGTRVGPQDPGIVRQMRGGELRRVHRDAEAEKRFHETLRAEGLEHIGTGNGELALDFGQEYRFPYPEDCVRFVCERVPVLREAGWTIEFDEAFEFRPVAAGAWHAEVREQGRDWFDLSLGVDIEGERVDLLPILVAILRARPELFAAQRSAPDEGTYIPVRLDDGRILPVPLARVRPILTVLDELLDDEPVRSLRLSRLDAPRLDRLAATAGLDWHGGEDVLALGHRLAGFDGVTDVAPPRGLRADLRPYQRGGLSWLQFLREYSLGGILADDMGLGKTLQALAHILVEKEAGRLTAPALIVAPTSVVPNWKAECAKFAPGLSVLVSHGARRKGSLARLADHDVVITSYPLLSRDREALEAQAFHLLILDEAQIVKNHKTQAAQVVRTLDARHRVCLSGTPLENHLGELWSLFHFLMPGFLGDATSFRRDFRTPIERHDDPVRRQTLERRVRPFLLRRTKEEVASELPAKTEIVVHVEFGDAQRELYEVVRASMDARIRSEIVSRGVDRSQIVVLDALLKLRQVCCDPRLAKMESARRVKDSAKLRVLVEMLESLVDEGRRVLVFSQFTEMIALIEEAIAKSGMRWVKLTGSTRDRETPVRTFQDGGVPVFLISLKAGGTGLNLTAADTVIHYDPWWNPAVERQATDRAHRIGQDKPVFVYKLIVSGSVEEKIAQLQTEKAALAEAILGEPGRAGRALTAEDIAALFEPLE
ncbi:MAG: helicase SNF2 [Betaproteobacteria bacterium]|nr:helicase SNF2 [Betaproteobacteria bacterium]